MADQFSLAALGAGMPAQPQEQSLASLGVSGPRAVPQGYNTKLDPGQEQFFRQWVQHNNVPFDVNATAPQDYDMRGFYQGLQQGNPRAQSAVDPNDGRLHFNDFWKTPAHPKFSNESQWAQPGAPQWADNSFNQLLSQGGRVLADDRTQPTQNPQDIPALARLMMAR